jgi:hypothetical protein
LIWLTWRQHGGEALVIGLVPGLLAVVVIVTGLDSLSQNIGDTCRLDWLLLLGCCCCSRSVQRRSPVRWYTAATPFSHPQRAVDSSWRWSPDRAGKDTIVAIMRWAIRILSLLGLLALAAEAVSFLQVEAFWFLVAFFGDNPFQVALALAAVLGILASLYAGRRGQRGWTAGFVVLALASILGPSIGPVLAVVVAGDPALHAGVERAFIPLMLVVVQLVRAALFVVALTYSLLPISQRPRLQVTAPMP